MKFYNREGVLYVRINGQRRSTFMEDTPKNRKLVASYYNNDEFFNNFNINKNVPTLVELCEEVLEEKEAVLKQTSYKAYESMFRNRIKNYFEDILISELKPKHIESWYKTFNDRSSLVTSESILKPAIEKAVLREMITTSPLIVTKPRFISSYSLNPFSYDEIQMLLKNSKTNWFRNFIAINFFTGMRTGELLGLKWEDVDFNEYTISINRTITSGFIQTPKTKSSQRVIDMIPQCEEFLKEQRKITGLSEYVFMSVKTNSYIKNSMGLYPRWTNLLKSCNLDSRGIYQLRHSFASNMLSYGEDLLWVSSMLGHKSANITLEKYTKYMRKSRKRKIITLDKSKTIDTKMAH